MKDNYMITADSFGSNLPNNWQEIADSINEYLTELWEAATDEGKNSFSETVREVWEDYCNHEGIDCLPLNLDRLK